MCRIGKMDNNDDDDDGDDDGGEVTTEATFIAASIVQCIAPAARSPTTVGVAASIDGGGSWSNNVRFTYFDANQPQARAALLLLLRPGEISPARPLRARPATASALGVPVIVARLFLSCRRRAQPESPVAQTITAYAPSTCPLRSECTVHVDATNLAPIRGLGCAFAPAGAAGEIARDTRRDTREMRFAPLAPTHAPLTCQIRQW